MSHTRLIIIALFVAIAQLSCGSEEAADDAVRSHVLVSAASSLTDLFEALSDSFELYHPSIAVQLNTGGSNVLVRQVQEDAPVNVLAIADERLLSPLIERGHINQDDVRIFAHNRLCIIVPRTSPDSVSDIASLLSARYHTIAIASVGVPVRRYSEEVFRAKNLWSRLANRFVYGANVRQVLTYVATGEADCGIVYTSDTVVSDDIRAAYTIPDSLHSPIRYPIVRIVDGPDSTAAADFVEFVLAPERAATYERYGFASPSGPHHPK